MRVLPRSLVSLCAAASGLFLVGCDPPPPIRGSYIYPTAVFAVNLHDAEGSIAVRRLLSGFSSEYGLHSVPGLSGPPRTDYIPYREDARYGISIFLTEYSEQCWIIQFSERSDTWTPKTLQALDDFTERLRKHTDFDAQLRVHPKPEQNYGSQGRDREDPAHLSDLCE